MCVVMVLCSVCACSKALSLHGTLLCVVAVPELPHIIAVVMLVKASSSTGVGLSAMTCSSFHHSSNFRACPGLSFLDSTQLGVAVWLCE